MKQEYLKEIRNRFRTELAQAYPPEEIESIFHLLIAHYFAFPKTILAMDPAKKISSSESVTLLRALDDLKKHRPVQQIMGHAYFMDMNLLVTPDVLIPRPETAELVAWVETSFGEQNPSTLSMLDAGTGSGCIALGLKRYLPDAKVYGIDISDAALKVARLNAEAQNLEITFLKDDLRHPESELPKMDAIVSNPPYVPESEAETMHLHVTASEPHLALFVPDEDPLMFYRYLCDFAGIHLKNQGWIYLETHRDHAEAVKALLEGRGFISAEVKKDIFDKNRFVRAKWNSMPPGSSGL